jgi:hypothetical protein
MTDNVSDPTAGRRARLVREHPDAPLPVSDPTDPRIGTIPEPSPAITRQDPTDPRYGEPV